MVSLEYVARVAGADPVADAEVLTGCRDAAVEWYAQSGVPADTEGALYTHWVANLAAWFFDNRGNPEANAQIPGYIVVSVHQLRHRESAGGDAGA